MSGGVYLIRGDRKLVEMSEQEYASEDLLQGLLADYPNLLAGDQIGVGEPRRWLLVSREVPLASEEDGSGRWSVDHLFLDQDAIPTIVEVRRSTDTRIRREGVGQMLDYAANAIVYWPVETLRDRFEEGREEAEQELAEFLERDTNPEECWQKARTNLQAGRVRLVFVADEISAELRRIVEFLNEQMGPAEVLAVEIKQYTGEGLKALVPRVIGQTVEAQRKKGDPTGRKPTEREEKYRQFFQKLIDQLREREFTKARVGQPQNWYSFASGFQGIGYGASFAQGGRVRVDLYIDRGDFDSNKKLFDALAEMKESLKAEFGEELAWERLNARRASRVAVYRTGSVEDSPQARKEIQRWMIDCLLKFRKVFGPRLAELVD